MTIAKKGGGGGGWNFWSCQLVLKLALLPEQANSASLIHFNNSQRRIQKLEVNTLNLRIKVKIMYQYGTASFQFGHA